MNKCRSSPSPLWSVKRCLWKPPSLWRSEREMLTYTFIHSTSVGNNKLLLQIFDNWISGKRLFLCFFLSSSTPGALYLQGYSLVCIVAFALLTSESSHIFIVHACCKQLVFELVLELVLEVFCFVFFSLLTSVLIPLTSFFVCFFLLWISKWEMLPMCNRKQRNCNLMLVLFTSAQSQIFANLWP